MTNYKKLNKLLDTNNGPIISYAQARYYKAKKISEKDLNFIFDQEEIKVEYIEWAKSNTKQIGTSYLRESKKKLP